MDLPFLVDLNGKTAVVTGGSGVLCSVMACALGKCGANVAVLGTRDETAEQGAEAVRSAGGRAIGIACDVTDKSSLESAHVRIAQEFGPCNILINGAGGNSPKATTSMETLQTEHLHQGDTGGTTLFDLTPAGVEFVFGVNFLGTFLATQIFARDMVDQRGGTIINISSMSAVLPLTKVPVYSAAKAAVANFTQWLAVHLADMKIRVNAISPGFFITRQNKALLTQDDGTLTARGKKIVNHTPMQRFGEADELVGTLLWLVSEDASGFVTGAIIPVDGGFSAFSGV